MATAHVLIVEDDPHIARLLCQFLQGEGYQAHAVASGEQALSYVRSHAPDLVVLDLMLPGMDGVATGQALRRFYSRPLLMLTSQEGDMQEVIALNAGIDDFMSKPVRPHVLKARIQALLRRHAPSPSILELPGWRIERDSRAAWLDGQPIALSDSEFELLWALACQAGEVVTREALFQRLRQREYDGLDRSIDMRVSKLRKTLAAYTDRELIRTLRQLGYIFLPS